ncbi:MAG: hypothetical protein ACR2NU_06855 [Aeoliella sp.]
MSVELIAQRNSNVEPEPAIAAVPRVLVAACSHEIRAVAMQKLQLSGYEVECYQNQMALSDLPHHPGVYELDTKFDVVLFDSQFGSIELIEVLERTGTHGHRTPCVLLDDVTHEIVIDGVWPHHRPMVACNPMNTIELLTTVRRIVPLVRRVPRCSCDGDAGGSY